MISINTYECNELKASEQKKFIEMHSDSCIHQLSRWMELIPLNIIRWTVTKIIFTIIQIYTNKGNDT